MAQMPRSLVIWAGEFASASIITPVSLVLSEVREGTMHVCVDFSVPQFTSIEKWRGWRPLMSAFLELR